MRFLSDPITEILQWIEALALAEEAGLTHLPADPPAKPAQALCNAMGRYLPAALEQTTWRMAPDSAWPHAQPIARATLPVSARAAPNVLLSKCHSWMVCADVPFLGFRCFLVQACCTTDWGGGCEIAVYV